MKKVLIAAVVVACVPLYCGATWLCANATRARIDQSLQRIADQSRGMIKIAAKKTGNHFFTSSEDITLEIDHPALQLLMKSGAIGNASNQFVIHNDIAYGPLPGLRSIGVARVETSVVLTDEQRKKLIEIFGTSTPVRIFTTFGYFGNSYVDVISPRLDIRPKDGSTATWKGLNLRFSIAPDARDVSFSGGSPGLVVNGKDRSVFQMNDIRFKGALQRKFDVLFDGEETLKIGAISFQPQDKPESSFAINDVVYGIKSAINTDFLNASASVGSGKVSYQNVSVEETHLDFGINHLDTKATVSLYKLLDEARTRAIASPANGTAGNPAQVDDMKQRATHDVLTLLQHAPVAAFNNIGFATSNGILKITGTATINDVVESDLLPTVQYDSLLRKIHAQSDISIDQQLIDHWPIAETASAIKQQTTQLEAQGYLLRKGDKLQSHVEYKDGKLTANGKPVGS